MNKEWNREDYQACHLCPRECKVDRTEGYTGICGVTDKVKLARAALHFWEEPCISGENGSGAVFFSGCSLHCVFCQNKEIAQGLSGKEIEDERLAEIFLELQEKKAHNINLVTPGQYAPHIIRAVESARNQGLIIPIVYNTSSYERLDTIKSLEGIVDIYLPDFKYMNENYALKYSHAADYPHVAQNAIAEMVRQQPNAFFENNIMERGIIVRHLLLPGLLYDSKQILKYLFETYGNQIYYSLMSQYTPLPHVEKYPELNRRVTKEAYEHLIDYARQLGITNGFMQEREVAEASFIPHFDCEGV